MSFWNANLSSDFSGGPSYKLSIHEASNWLSYFEIKIWAFASPGKSEQGWKTWRTDLESAWLRLQHCVGTHRVWENCTSISFASVQCCVSNWYRSNDSLILHEAGTRVEKHSFTLCAAMGCHTGLSVSWLWCSPCGAHICSCLHILAGRESLCFVSSGFLCSGFKHYRVNNELSRSSSSLHPTGQSSCLAAGRSTDCWCKPQPYSLASMQICGKLPFPPNRDRKAMEILR